tara:strand:- start:449 stop:859 length:411 start_codon:yes stop_codon:yes gene_type:complete
MRFLFDRLCSPSKRGKNHYYSSIKELRTAIETELQRILSQRSYFYGLDSFTAALPDSVLNYGLRSIVDVDDNHESLAGYASEVEKVIALYEPRLRDCRVLVTENEDRVGKKVFLISGKIGFNHQDYDFGVSVPITG